MCNKPMPLQLVMQNQQECSKTDTEDSECPSLMHQAATVAERQGHNLEGFQTTQELLILIIFPGEEWSTETHVKKEMKYLFLLMLMLCTNEAHCNWNGFSFYSQ